MAATRRSFLQGTGIAGLLALSRLETSHVRAGAEDRATPQAIALGIGLNEIDPAHYGTNGKLTACEADARDVMAIAQRKGFQLHGGTGLLLTKKATRSAVKKAIGEIAEQLQPGAICLLHYSGHGGQVPDRNGDELDGKDETWCLYDGQLVDDELYAQYAKFREGVRILVLSDSCHSGTVSRTIATVAAINSNAFGQAESLADRDIKAVPNIQKGGTRGIPENLPSDENRPGAFRTLPDDVLATAYFNNKEFYDRVLEKAEGENPRGNDVEVKASILLISGCQDNQLSQDGTFNGLFTGTLKRVWRNGQFNGNYQKFHRQIVDLMPPTQTPNFYPVGKPDPSFWMQQPFSI